MLQFKFMEVLKALEVDVTPVEAGGKIGMAR